MKRIGALLVSGWLCVMLLGGCGSGGSKPVQPVTAGFSCRIEATYGDMTVAGTLTRPGADTLRLQFDKPASLSGVTLGYDGSRVTMELAGMSLKLDPERVPQSALIRLLLGALTATPTGGQLTDEGYVVTGQLDDRAFTLVFDPVTGMPGSLSVPEDGLQATFTRQETVAAA